jgi:hypothetical protein
VIQLEAPVSRGGYGTTEDEPIFSSPAYGRTRNMRRWHIPRSGRRYARMGHTAFQTWCGGAALTIGAWRPGREAIFVDEITDGLPVCGTCAGRALGTGVALETVQVAHEPGLLFEPTLVVRWPRTCPGAGYASWHDVDSWKVGRCYVCLELVPIRGPRGYETTLAHLARHDAGPDLVNPCPFHLWDRITVEGVCSCGAEPVPVKEPWEE